VLQADRGLIYGDTLFAQGTAPPVITLAGAPAVPIPIRVECTLAGALGAWQGHISFDGGVTFPQTFTSSAVPLPLTGAGSGVALTIAPGNASANNVWRATCATLQDQSGNGKHATQLGSTVQPIVTPGLNGKVGIAGEARAYMRCIGFALPLPSTVRYHFAVFRLRNAAANQSVFGRGDAGLNFDVTYQAADSRLTAYNGLPVGNNRPLGPWQIIERDIRNQATDVFKVGSLIATGDAGNGATSDPQIFASAGGGLGDFELLATAHTPVQPDWAAIRAAINSPAGYGAGAIEV